MKNEKNSYLFMLNRGRQSILKLEERLEHPNRQINVSAKTVVCWPVQRADDFCIPSSDLRPMSSNSWFLHAIAASHPLPLTAVQQRAVVGCLTLGRR